MTDQQEPADLGAELARDQADAYPQRDEWPADVPREVMCTGGLTLRAPSGGAS